MNYVIHNATTDLTPQIETCRGHALARPGCAPDCEACADRLAAHKPALPLWATSDYEPERPTLTLAMLEDAYRELIAAAVPAEMINNIPFYRI